MESLAIKTLWAQDKSRVDGLRSIVTTTLFKEACVYALGYVSSSSASDEHACHRIAGAKAMLDALKSLSTEEQTKPAATPRNLTPV